MFKCHCWCGSDNDQKMGNMAKWQHKSWHSFLIWRRWTQQNHQNALNELGWSLVKKICVVVVVDKISQIHLYYFCRSGNRAFVMSQGEQLPLPAQPARCMWCVGKGFKQMVKYAVIWRSTDFFLDN